MYEIRRFWVVGLLGLFGACAQNPVVASLLVPSSRPDPTPARDADFAVVKTVFATDRNLQDSASAKSPFGEGRA